MAPGRPEARTIPFFYLWYHEGVSQVESCVSGKLCRKPASKIRLLSRSATGHPVYGRATEGVSVHQGSADVGDAGEMPIETTVTPYVKMVRFVVAKIRRHDRPDVAIVVRLDSSFSMEIEKDGFGGPTKTEACLWKELRTDDPRKRFARKRERWLRREECPYWKVQVVYPSRNQH